jgi:hypothetical protein
MRGILVALLGVVGCNHGNALAPATLDGGTDLAAPLDLGLCPPGVPSGACVVAKLECDYNGGLTNCVCLDPERRWSCCGDAPPQCPPARPADGEPCCPGLLPTCNYCEPSPPMACFCSDNHWHCGEVSIQCPPPDLG